MYKKFIVVHTLFAFGNNNFILFTQVQNLASVTNQHALSVTHQFKFFVYPLFFFTDKPFNIHFAYTLVTTHFHSCVFRYVYRKCFSICIFNFIIHHYNSHLFHILFTDSIIQTQKFCNKKGVIATPSFN